MSPPRRDAQRKQKRPVALTVAALAVGAGLAVAVISGLIGGTKHPKPAPARVAAQPTQQPPTDRAPEAPPVATQAPDTIPPMVEPPAALEPAPPSRRTIIRYETPSDKITVRPIGDGFEIYNTDPSLVGKQVEITGVTNTGERVSYTLVAPPPPPAVAEDHR